jgi:cell wall assembly regulator SMI1
MQEIWERIDAWLRVNASKVFDRLQPGASDSAIEAVENALSIQFPDDVKASYRIHNGQSDSDYGLMVDAQEFLSLERIQAEWSVWKGLLDKGSFEGGSDPDQGIRADWYNAKWIPLTSDGCGDNYCLDLAPAEGGNVGQIIMMVHDDVDRQFLAPSFRSWLEDYATKLESGEYVFSEKYVGIRGIMTLHCLQGLDEPKPRSLPDVSTIVTTKSVIISFHDGNKQPPSREAPTESKDEVMLALNGEPILQNILLDSIEQFYTIELAPGVNTVTVTLVAHATPVLLVMPFVTIDKHSIHPGSPNSEYHFGFTREGNSGSFTIMQVTD